ncbi:unnamed protein product [Cuscuta europaea]|uniref:AP2/ERF domain-containing protein n=1 Tax=Cuscuta europaea TaxID=41803 RepID=A0A9P1EMM8_CUSEU|nr:unnamed protein product [Cuscuta europaea]
MAGEETRDLRKVKILVTYPDPEATDSSSDEADQESKIKRLKRAVYEGFIRSPAKSGKSGSDPDTLTGIPSPLTEPDNSHVSDPETDKGNRPRRYAPGVRKRKWGKWCAEIRNPHDRRRVWLGTFDSEEAASQAYVSKKLEFENAKQGINKEIKTLPLDVSVSDQPEKTAVLDPDPKPDSRTVQAQDPKPLNPGLRKEKEGKWGATIKDPFKKRRIWLGTFGSEEAASQAYLNKKLELENANQGNKKKIKTCPVPVVSVSCEPEKIAVPDPCPISDSHISPDQNPKPSSPGVRKKQGGKWGTTIRNPFTKMPIWLGTFDSEEAASQAYLKQKLEFENATQGVKETEALPVTVDSIRHEPEKTAVPDPDPTSYSSIGPCQNPKPPIPGVRKKGRKWGATIRNPFNKQRIWLGSFDSEVAASNAYLKKKLEFDKATQGIKETKALPVPVDSVRHEPEKTTNPVPDPMSYSSISPGQNPKPPNPGVRKKGRKWGATIRNPFNKRRIWLGSFDSEVAASNAYLKKKLEFEEAEQRIKKKKIRILPFGVHVNSKPSSPPIPLTESEKSTVSDPDPQPYSSKNSEAQPVSHMDPDPCTGHIPRTTTTGLRRSKRGRSGAQLKSQFQQRLVWHGRFKNPELERIAKSKQGKKKKKRKNPLSGPDPGPGPVTRSAARSKQGLNNYYPVINPHPIINSETSEEATHDNQCVRQLSQNSNVVPRRVRIKKMARISPVGIHPITEDSFDDLGTFETLQSQKVHHFEDEEDGGMWLGKWVPIANGREVSFSMKYGVPIIDNYGYLLGEFQRLDDDLWICTPEDDAHQA